MSSAPLLCSVALDVVSAAVRVAVTSVFSVIDGDFHVGAAVDVSRCC